MRRMGMALALCVVAGVVGCGSKPTTGAGPGGGGDTKTNALVGTWEMNDPGLKGITVALTFTADGKYTQETIMEGLPKEVKVDNGKEEGTYKQEAKTVTLTTQGKDKKITVKELTDSKAVFANGEGKEMTFTKKK